MNSPQFTMIIFPSHLNGTGVCAFGGVVFNAVDLAATIESQRVSKPLCLTRTIEITFEKPILLGDILSATANVTDVGNSAIEFTVTVEVDRVVSDDGGKRREKIVVATARAIFVAVDQEGKKTSVIGWDGQKPVIPQNAE
jgi:acyl-CoA hydrolase